MPPKKRSRKASVAETPPAVKVEEEIGEETPQFEEIDEKNVVLEEFTPNKRRKKLQNAPESTRSSGRGGGSVFHFDDESNQFYPCPKCDLHFNARASRNFHMRIAHHGYVYTPGDELKRFQNEDVEVKKPKGKKFAKKVDKVEDFGNVKIENSEQNVDFEANFCAPGNSQESEIFDNFHFSDDVQDVAVEVEVAGVPEPCDSSLLDHDYAYFGMHVEEEHHEIEEAEQVDEYFEKEQVLAAPASAQPHRRGRPPKAKEDFSISIKLTMSDPQGKYKCYVKDCDWKGGYRSMRAQHMRVIHPEWKMPDRFLLQRITKDNMYIDPKDHVPLYKCHVDGCDWRGNFRATRSAHMRKVHPNIHEERRKAPAGGFVADGQYFCHVEGCEWRGCSRSTRASHMRREHADYVFGQQVDEAGHKVPRTMIQCCECNFECYSQQVLVDHVKRSHGLTFFVHRRFKNKLEFECWLRSVKRAYSIDFKKNPPIRLTTGEQLTYYHCSHTTQPNQQISFRSRYFQNRKRYSMKRKHRPCTAYLKVNESLKGVMTVDGCVEHFGHRMGLPMLRFGKLDRECMGAFLEQKSCGMPMTLDGALEKLRSENGEP
ncbi:unnamed protein product [Caenorhabditis auriculariae]|uniref:C2H2-type domain-containing protein n=1 Tax=Caenorhabditis auriculariae TaxID=2777116 RepID=A0A8S1HW24_9PELO|nr:unnamed protein product [Caenorhabditis auriculariae]